MRAGCWSSFFALALLGACGRLNFSPLGTDGMPSDGPPADACQFGPWSTPQRLAVLSAGGNDWGGQISADGLDFYFASDRAGTFDVYESHRTDRTQAFTSPSVMPIASLNTTGSAEDDISVSSDGLEVYFGSDRGPSCIYHASRGQKTDPFGNLTALPLCGALLASGAYITPDGLSFYYNVGPSTGAPWGSLMLTTRASTADPIVAGAPIASLQGGEDKGFPALSADELTLYFETASPNHHLWQATRPDRASAFGNAVLIPGINDIDLDEDASITADGLELYFSSRRTGTSGVDFFVATRACL